MSRCIAVASLSLLVGLSLLGGNPGAAQAQTSYPMLMSCKPVAAQQGQTSEHVVSSRYNLLGAYQVLVEGQGVTGEVVPPDVKIDDPAKPPMVQKLTIRFTVAADALPGEREFRLATPQGVSTVGQLVISRDPVAVETEPNEQAAQATPVTLPAAICGSIAKAEDVDYFKFTVEAGTQWTFNVRSQRLQNKIHDLQQHVDPIMSIRNSAGATVAASDNYFFGDPALTHRFEQAGEYFLEIRDVRYLGNEYWEYAIEASQRPLVNQAYPLGVAAGAESPVELIGFHLPSATRSTLRTPAEASLGMQWLSSTLPAELGGEATNPFPVYVSELPLVLEDRTPAVATGTESGAASEAAADPLAGAQPIRLPAGINGRIAAEREIDLYKFTAAKGDVFSFRVLARQLQSSLDSHLRVLNDKGAQVALNDDFRLGNILTADSWIEAFTAPADGDYYLEIRDLHLRGGADFPYFIEARRAEPTFVLRLDSDKTQLSPGVASPIFARIDRKNGFDGEVTLEIEGLPPGVAASCGRILAGKAVDGCIVLQAADDAQPSVSEVIVRGRAVVKAADGSEQELVIDALPMQETYMPGGGRSHWPVGSHAVAVGAPSDIRKVTLSTTEITLAPGGSQRIDVTIERAPDFKANVTLGMVYDHLNSIFVNALPEGVTIDGKNSKTLLSGGESVGHITLIAADNAPPAEKQQVPVMANISINFVMKTTYSGPPVFVTVTPK